MAIVYKTLKFEITLNMHVILKSRAYTLCWIRFTCKFDKASSEICIEASIDLKSYTVA